VRGRDVGGRGTLREQGGVEAVAVDRHGGHPHALGLERGPGLRVAGVLQRHGGADEVERRGQGPQRRPDARHYQQLLGCDRDTAAAAQVLGQHLAQAGVRRTGTGVVAGHHRAGGAPRTPPGGRVDQRGVRAPGAQVPPGRLAGSGFGNHVGAGGAVHVGDGTGGGREVGPGRDHRAGPRPARHEAGRGQLVVGRNDRTP
jgi:hypothetical protein